MSTTIKQIRKVNVYEEDENRKRTLVQKDVPLGSNVVLEEKIPESRELKLLVGEKDDKANEIKLYPTSITVSSDGTINAKDFLIDNNNIKGKFVSNVYWGEDSSTTPPVRRLYYKINDNSFQVKNSGGTNALNLLQVPYLELYSTNTIKTTDSTDPLYLNVDNVTSTHLAKSTKVVLGHTAIKDSSLDLVDNGRNYLGARLGIDMREDYLYGYLNFYKTVKDGKNTKNYEIGSIFASGDNSLCIMPRNIYYENINKPETNKDGSIKEILPVIAGSVGTLNHKFEHMWAKNLHGNINPVVYNGAAPDSNVSLADLGFKDQLIYIGGDFGKSDKLIDMPFDSENGYCITLKTSNDKNTGTIKQIFIRGGQKGVITERRIYIRTGYKGTDTAWSYGDWTPALGHTDWVIKDELQNKGPGIDRKKGDDYYTIAKGDIEKATVFIQRRQFLDMYQSYDSINHFFRHLSITGIKTKIDDAIKNYKGSSNRVACAVIEGKCYTYSKNFSVKREMIDFIFTYNANKEVCLVGIDGSRTGSIKNLRFKQYD